MRINVVATIKAAWEKAIKNRAIAIDKAARPFDEEIEAYELALKGLGAVAPSISHNHKNNKKSSVSSRYLKTGGRKTGTKAISIPGSYPIEGTIYDKMAFAIGRSKRMLSMQEISEIVRKHEPSFSLAMIKKRFGKHLDTFQKHGKIVTYEGQKRNFYGLPGYMENGKPLKSFQPLEKRRSK